MNKICITCDINESTDSLTAISSSENIPLWSKKEGVYSMLPKFVQEKEYNPNKTKLKTETPKLTDTVVRVPIKTKIPETWVLYWASLPNDKLEEFNDDPAEAYGDEKNRGLIKTDSKGEGLLVLNCPQLYTEDNVLYPRHVHYSTLTSENVWDTKIRTMVVTCNISFEDMKKISKMKTHIIINASDSEKDIDNSFKLKYKKLKKIPKEDRYNHISETIENNLNNYKNLKKYVKTGELEIKYIPIVVYCNNDECKLAKKLIKLLIESGFVNIVKYSGGIEEWENNKVKLDIDDFEDSEVLYYQGRRFIHHLDTGDITNEDYEIIGKLVITKDKVKIDFNNDKQIKIHNNIVSNKPDNDLDYEPDDNIKIETEVDIEEMLENKETLGDDKLTVKIPTTEIEDNTDEETEEEEDTDTDTDTEEEKEDSDTEEEKEDTDTEEDTDSDSDIQVKKGGKRKKKKKKEEKEDTDTEEEKEDNDMEEEEKEDTDMEEEEKEDSDNEEDSINIKNNNYISTNDFNKQFRGWGLFQMV